MTGTYADYTLVIATFERAAELRTTLQSLGAQTRVPTQVIVVDASRNDASRAVVDTFADQLPLRWECAREASAAKQRNQGAENVSTALVGFVDDDVFLPSETFAKLCSPFDEDPSQSIGGVAGRITGMQHSKPGKLLWLYYRLQAGFEDSTYGARLFGAAVNCLPTYEEAAGDLIESDWLNSTCVLYRTAVFQRQRFPEFDGYSFLEDVHLSARVRRTHQLFFHRSAHFEHLDAPSNFKKDARHLAQMRWRHRRRVAREILQLREPELTFKLLLHRLFDSASVLRQRSPGWGDALLGTWL
jgi:GT2 family glycosyltransferase